MYYVVLEHVHIMRDARSTAVDYIEPRRNLHNHITIEPD